MESEVPEDKNEGLSNRDKKLAPKSRNGFWCICDFYYIQPGGRCPGCRRRPGKKRFKK